MQLPMRLDLETALYVQKLQHVSATCRLTLEEEQRALQLIEDQDHRLQIARQHLESVPKKQWAEKVECKKFLAALQALLRSASLPVHIEDAKQLLVQSSDWKHLPPDMVATLSNRRSALEALGRSPQGTGLALEPCRAELVLPARGTGPKSALPGSLFQSKDMSFLTRSPDTIVREIPFKADNHEKLKVDAAIALICRMLADEKKEKDTELKLFWLLYSCLTPHKGGVKVQVRSGQLCSHSHSFGSLLFFLSDFNRSFGTRQSLLRLMIQNQEL